MPLTCQESSFSQGEEAERASTPLNYKTFSEQKDTNEAFECENEPLLSNEELESSPLIEQNLRIGQRQVER
jgi:hypothetical protein